RVGGEERRLFRIGAEPRDDEKIDAVARRSRGHVVEGGSDVRAHALAIAVYERAAVAATAGHRRHPPATTCRGRGFGDGAGENPPAPRSLERSGDCRLRL